MADSKQPTNQNVSERRYASRSSTTLVQCLSDCLLFRVDVRWAYLLWHTARRTPALTEPMRCCGYPRACRSAAGLVPPPRAVGAIRQTIAGRHRRTDRPTAWLPRPPALANNKDVVGQNNQQRHRAYRAAAYPCHVLEGQQGLVSHVRILVVQDEQTESLTAKTTYHGVSATGR